MGVAGGSTKSRMFAWRRVPVCRQKAPALVWIAEGGRGCGQVDEDARTRLESGGCGGGRGPSHSFAEWRCVGRSTKDPRAHLRSGGWQWAVWGRPKPSHSLEGAVASETETPCSFGEQRALLEYDDEQSY